MNTYDPVLRDIEQCAERVAEFVPNAIWYLFGSYATKPETAVDIDILVVCADLPEAKTIRPYISELLWPIDLLVMTGDEAKQTDFVRNEGCIQIYPVI